MMMQYAKQLPVFTAGGRREAEIATPTRELVFAPRTDRATPTPEGIATRRTEIARFFGSPVEMCKQVVLLNHADATLSYELSLAFNWCPPHARTRACHLSFTNSPLTYISDVSQRVPASSMKILSSDQPKIIPKMKPTATHMPREIACDKERFPVRTRALESSNFPPEPPTSVRNPSLTSLGELTTVPNVIAKIGPMIGDTSIDATTTTDEFVARPANASMDA